MSFQSSKSIYDELEYVKYKKKRQAIKGNSNINSSFTSDLFKDMPATDRKSNQEGIAAL